MRKLQFIGNLGSDAEIKETQAGKKLLVFDVACSEKFGGETYTHWIKCSKFINDDNKLVQYLTKGTTIWAEGNPDTESWINQQGETKSALKCYIRELKLLGSRQSSNSNPEQQQSTQTQEPFEKTTDSGEVNDDLPF